MAAGASKPTTITMIAVPSKTTFAALSGLAVAALASQACTSQPASHYAAPQARARPVLQQPAPSLAANASQFPTQRVAPSAPRPRVSAPAPVQHRGGSVVELNSANFDATINRPGSIVLLDFAADWCGPCRQLAPTIEQVARNFGGQEQVVIARIDVDQEPELADRYGVEILPTLLYLKNGQVRKTSVGPASGQEISANLTALAQ